MGRPRIDVVTLFPEMLAPALGTSILGRATACGKLTCRLWDLREFGVGRHRITDDLSYGGGIGMVMRPEPFFAAVTAIRADGEHGGGTTGEESAGAAGDERVILFGPAGRRLDQSLVEELSRADHLILLCGHYEGVDERVRQVLATDEVSLGDFVLTGGEIAALALIDALARLLPGVLPEGATVEESFSWGLLEYPQYTRPERWSGLEVPCVLRRGNRRGIERWRRKEALRRTLRHRPDLLARFRASETWLRDPTWEELWQELMSEERPDQFEKHTRQKTESGVNQDGCDAGTGGRRGED